MFIDPDGRRAMAPSQLELLQSTGGALGYMLGGGAATFGSFAEFLGEENPLAKFNAMSESSAGGASGISESTINKMFDIGGYWTNTGYGFTSNENIALGYDGSYLSLNTTLDKYFEIPEVVLKGDGSGWGSQIQGHFNSFMLTGRKNDHWFQPVADVINNGLNYFLKDLLYIEVSGELNMGSYFDIGLKNGIELNIGERSTIADFNYTKDAGQILADYSANTYERGEKGGYTIGGAYGLGVSFTSANDNAKSITIGILGFGYTRTWGGGSPSSNFVGLDTGASLGIGFGGSINIKTGLKW